MADLNEIKRLRAGTAFLDGYTAKWGNDVLDALEARTPRKGSGTRLRFGKGGFSYSARGGVLARYSPGFIVVPGETASTIQITGDGSVVSGLDKVYVPKIGDTGIDQLPNPELAVSDGLTVSIRIELEPDTEEIPDSSPTAYRFKNNGYSVIGGGLTIVTDQSDEVFPVIDQSSGEISQNGVYHIPLSAVAVSGGAVTVGFKSYDSKGPLAVKFCDGALPIMGAIQIHAGDLQTFDDE